MSNMVIRAALVVCVATLSFIACGEDLLELGDRRGSDCTEDYGCNRNEYCTPRGTCALLCRLDNSCSDDDFINDLDATDTEDGAEQISCVEDEECDSGDCHEGFCAPIEQDATDDDDADDGCVGDDCEEQLCDSATPLAARCAGDIAISSVFVDMGCYQNKEEDCAAQGLGCALRGSYAICADVCDNSSDCDGDEICEVGMCVPRCFEDSDCLHYEAGACTRGICDTHTGYCFVEPDVNRQDAPDDVFGDCRRPICENGRETYVVDNSDVPTFTPFDCIEATCDGGMPVLRERDDRCDEGLVCSSGHGGCVDPAEIDDYCMPNEPIDPPPPAVCGDGYNDEGCSCTFGAVQRCYTGPLHTRGVGQCTDGFQTCVGQSNPTWGPCQGEIHPMASEVCDGRDNTCNGCEDDGLFNCTEGFNCPENTVAEPLRNHELDLSEFGADNATNVRWSVTPPANSNAGVPENPNDPQTQFYMDVSGDYHVHVQFVDEKGAMVGCSWIVSARGAGLRVEMTWDTYGSVDMDLHLLRDVPGAKFCHSTLSCYYSNCKSGNNLDWGYPASPSTACPFSRCPNPRLDIDNIRGYDPENINIDNPEHGDKFRVMAHMYSGSRETNPIITIYCGGRPAGIFGAAPDLARISTSGSACGGHTWRVADVTMIVDPVTGATDCDVAFLPGNHYGYEVRTNNSER